MCMPALALALRYTPSLVRTPVTRSTPATARSTLMPDGPSFERPPARRDLHAGPTRPLSALAPLRTVPLPANVVTMVTV